MLVKGAPKLSIAAKSTGHAFISNCIPHKIVDVMITHPCANNGESQFAFVHFDLVIEVKSR